MRLSSLLCLSMLCLASGCFKPAENLTVKPMDEREFRAMAVDLRPQLTQKGVLDRNGAWYSPVFSLAGLGFSPAKSAGSTLLDRLSPAFRFPGSDPALLPSTFRAMLTDEARVTVTDHAFTVEQGLDRLHVSLLALTDWNRDGRDDWLLLCRVEPQSTPGRRRDYYLVLTDLTRDVLVPQVLAVRDCVDGRCRMVDNPADPGLAPDSPAVELMQGQQTVTRPPESGPAAAPRQNGLRESALSH